MAKELFISSTPHETKVAVVEDEQLAEIYFERENEYTLAGSIYKGRVTRVLPGMQSAFVDIGLERDAFLYVTDFLEEQEDQDDFDAVPRHVESQPVTFSPTSNEAPSTPNAGTAEGNQSEASAQQSESGEESFDRGPKRWRGRRGRRRGRGGFEEHGSQQATPVASPAQESAPAEEPVILPGESLSKYKETEEAQEADRGAQHQQTTEAREQSPPAPSASTEQRSVTSSEERSFSVLPGESLSKYRGRGDGNETSAETRPPAPPREERKRDFRSEQPTRYGERPRWEAPSGPSVQTLPGESLAKYRKQSQEPGSESVVRAHESEAHAEKDVMRSEVSEHIAVASDVEHAEPEQEISTRRGSGGVMVAPNVDYAEPEQSDAEERMEHALQHSRSEQAQNTAENSEPPQSNIDEPESQSASHEFGSGVLEEEVIEEEELEPESLGEDFDEEHYEELEEHTLDPYNAEQLVEAVREAHVIQRLGLREGEPADLEDHSAGEEVHHEVEAANGEATHEEHEAANEEASDFEDVSFEQQEEEHEHEEAVQAEEMSEENGHAEVRAPANTAAFQQRAERTDRAERGPDRFRRGRRGRPMRGRRNIQRESQPTISDLLKEGQEILVQIAKEPIAKKGARITSHIALPGRFLVYMPTVDHVGVSRKIGSDEERQRLKRVLINEKGNAHGGFIVRTAAAGASDEDLRSDLRFLINLWNDIKSRSENSKAPALIYHDLNLVERILRDQVTSNFTSIWMDTEQEYERIVRFLGRFQPGLVRRAKLYTKETPLFEQFGIQEEINNALKSKVWLKSGGYIVINQTEALVAIDINTGKYVGKTGRLEDTIVKTNIDAIKEIVRQIRLRDLGGIIVIDFIDMDERKNRQRVMQALEEALKSDRAPSKVLQFNDFGLVAITRKRVKQSLERTLSSACTYCTGTGMIKSVQTVCNEIYVEMRKMVKHFERRDVLLRVNPEVVKALKGNNARWLQEMEELTGRTIIVKSDPVLHQEQFDIN